MASWSSVSFGERGNGANTFPTFGREGELTVRHYPGGNVSDFQATGLTAEMLALNISCTQAQLNSLRAKVNTRGTLSYSYGSRSNMYLRSISSPEQVGANDDLYFATLNFVG